MSTVQIDYNVKIGTGNGLAMDTWLAKQAFKWCKEQYPWFAEACEKGQIALEGNKVVSSGFSIPFEDCSKIFDWTEGVYKQFKPAQLSVRNVVHVTDDDGGCNPRSACFYIANAEADATAPAAYKFRRLMDIRVGKFDCVTESGETREYYYQMVDSQEAFLLGRNFLEEKDPHNVALRFKKDEQTSSEVVEIWPLSTLKMDEDTLADKMDRGSIKTEDAIIKDEFFLAVGGYHAMPLLDSEGNPVSMLEAMDVQKTFAGTRYEDWSFEGIEYEFGKVEPLLTVKPAKKAIEPKQAKKSTAAKKKTTRKKEIEVAEEGSFTDPRDGHVYKTVKLCGKEWLAENLAFKMDGSYAYYDNEEDVKEHGRYYTWEAANRCAPEGWHLPTREEYEELLSLETKKLKKDFKPLMTGMGFDHTTFVGLKCAFFWTATKGNVKDCAVNLFFDRSGGALGDQNLASFGMSVRLVRDEK